MAKRPKKTLRDAFGRFRKRGAPALPPPVKRNLPPRSVTGKFLNQEQRQAREAEELQRLVDRSFMSPLQLQRLQRREKRAQQVKEEKESRYARIQARPELYRHNTATIEETAHAQRQISAGIMPRATEVVEHGVLSEHVFMFHGPHALQAAQDLLQLMRKQFPADAMGALAMGNGRGKNATWIGTKFGTPSQVWQHSQTFLSSKSGNTVSLMQLPQAEQDASIWAEVKMTTQGRVDYEPTAEPGRRKGAGKKPQRASKSVAKRKR